tara:strand:- start:1480 stop:2229 length:750 start_codon:yes stop_codon:yes gene_type:complete
MSGALEQIRKLLRLANNAGATEGEVQAALGRAAHLAAKHNISDVEIQRATRSDGTEGVRINVEQRDIVKRPVWVANNLSRWDRQLIGAAADASNCGGYIGWHDGRPALWLYGLPADVEVGRELLAFARETMSRCARRWAKAERTKGHTWVTGNCMEVRSYKDGFCRGLRESARQGPPDGEQVQLTNGDSTALVLVQDVNEAKRAAITIYRGTLGLGRGRRTRTRKTCTQSSGAGYNQGRQTSLARNAVK